MSNATALAAKKRTLEQLRKELSVGVNELDAGPVTIERAEELEMKARGMRAIAARVENGRSCKSNPSNGHILKVHRSAIHRV
jgi:hypothetical protein